MKAREHDWGFVFFSDEMSIWLDKSVPGGRWKEEMEIEASSESTSSTAMEEEEVEERDNEYIGSHGPKVHCWAAISARGATRLEIFKDNFNGPRYKVLLQKGRKQMQKLYPEGWILQHDGHPVHL